MASTSAATARTAAHLAGEAFRHHRLTRDGAHWLCRSPKSSHYWFCLYAAPGMVAIWGDIGECVLRHAGGDSLGWLADTAGPGRINYPDYCLGKIEALDGPKREFYPGDARAYVRERLRETVDECGDVDTDERERWEAVALAFRNGLDDYDSERAEWFAACRENGVDDPPDCEGWSSGALWIWHALVTFVRLHQAPEQGAIAARNLAAAYHPHREDAP